MNSVTFTVLNFPRCPKSMNILFVFFSVITIIFLSNSMQCTFDMQCTFKWQNGKAQRSGITIADDQPHIHTQFNSVPEFTIKIKMQCNQLCLLFLWTIHFKTSTLFSLQSKEERLLLAKSANWTGTAVTIYCETAHVSQLAKWLPEASFISFTTQVTCSVQPVPLNSKQWALSQHKVCISQVFIYFISALLPIGQNNNAIMSQISE